MKAIVPCLLLAVLLGCGHDIEPSPPGPPPNILVLLIDCLRSDRLSANGYERPTTPNLDTLVQEGVTFRRASSQASWTRPSLPTILTGLYPSEHGVQSFLDDGSGSVLSPALPEAVTTAAEALGRAGYDTALVGHQHQLEPRFGLAQGFDYFKHRAGPADRIRTRFLRWLDHRGAGDSEAPAGSPNEAAAAAGPRPFFAFLHFLEIHWPYCPPENVGGTFDDGRSDVLWCVDWRELRDRIDSGELVLEVDDWYAMAARYDEELLGLDRRIGVLFEELRRRGLWDDTLIVLTSDHGEELGEHGRMGHSQSLYQELVAVPLVVKPPASWKVAVPQVSQVVVENRFLTSTFLEIAGAAEKGRGPSLLPWILEPGRTPGPQEYAVSEAADQVAVRAGDWKLIAARDGSAFELYDLADDPGETRSVAAEHRRKLAELRGYLKAWHEGLLPAPEVEMREIDTETAEGLRALGYLR